MFAEKELVLLYHLSLVSLLGACFDSDSPAPVLQVGVGRFFEGRDRHAAVRVSASAA